MNSPHITITEADFKYKWEALLVLRGMKAVAGLFKEDCLEIIS
jgi:hypothetical protein